MMPEKKTTKKTASKTKTANGSKKAAAGGFSLEDALNIAKTSSAKSSAASEKKAEKEKQKRAIEEAEQKNENRVLGAASLADILGTVSAPTQSGPPQSKGRSVPREHEKFFNLLMELRNHVSEGLNLHAEETLKRSSKDDAGDLSSYSQHMADAGTDTFDRDFALSMVSSEQDALSEIDAAIERIYEGTYGICQMTGKKIRDERLMAVPFTRHSIASQTQIEKGQSKSVQRGGAFAESAADNPMGYSEEELDG